VAGNPQAFDWVDSTPKPASPSSEWRRQKLLRRHRPRHARQHPAKNRSPDGARSREALRRLILDLQDCLSSIERCRKPVIAAIQGACVGGALDLVTCCDMRYAAADAIFAIKEIDLGMVADVGTLQRLPHLIGEGMTRELAYTGRKVDASEAEKIGLINRIFASNSALTAAVRTGPNHRRQIAARHSRPQGSDELQPRPLVADGLNHVATWNAACCFRGTSRNA
jgi:enoyl-CoA hydratase